MICLFLARVGNDELCWLQHIFSSVRHKRITLYFLLLSSPFTNWNRFNNLDFFLHQFTVNTFYRAFVPETPVLENEIIVDAAYCSRVRIATAATQFPIVFDSKWLFEGKKNYYSIFSVPLCFCIVCRNDGKIFLFFIFFYSKYITKNDLIRFIFYGSRFEMLYIFHFFITA